MKKLLAVTMLVAFASLAFAAPDTIYNKQGQAVQVYAPNHFQTLTVNKTSIDLVNTLAFEIDSSIDLVNTLAFEIDSSLGCVYYLTATNTTTGAVSQNVPAGELRLRGVGHGIKFANISGCTGAKYSSMKGDWAGQ